MYQPAEDSFLLSAALKKYLAKLKSKNIDVLDTEKIHKKNFRGAQEPKKLNLRVLDMGSGSGIQAKTAEESGIKKENILCADIDKEVVEKLKQQKFNAVHSDLFQNLKSRKFDLVIFNPPYLPEDKYDKKKDTTGGKKGDETILKFMKQSKSHLNKNGKIIILLSSLTPRARILKEISKQKLHIEKLAKEKSFFETLEVYLLS